MARLSIPSEVSLGLTVATLASVFVRPVVTFVFRYFLRPKRDLKRDYQGTWAVITGASAGIGLEIALLLAQQGIHLVLIARNLSTLRDVAKKIESKYGVKTRVVSIDAAECKGENSQSLFEDLMDILKPLSVSILINNVSVHNDIPANIEDMLPGDAERILTVNCLFQIELTALMVPLLKCKHAKSPLIVNISSLTSQMTMPMLSVYAASKAFQEHWSRCLSAEVEPTGILVQCLRPGITVSRMSGISSPSFFCPSASVMARACVNMFGRPGLPSCAPYWPHAILDGVNEWVPYKLAWKAVRIMHQKKRQEMMNVQT